MRMVRIPFLLQHFDVIHLDHIEGSGWGWQSHEMIIHERPCRPNSEMLQIYMDFLGQAK